MEDEIFINMQDRNNSEKTVFSPKCVRITPSKTIYLSVLSIISGVVVG